ncbi:MAG TPA: hypothetical protein VNT54_16280 [Solirubrobacteraceae bacterium]|nr:hypothetical protein [Solirubrobacteraceae bacterium]
MSDPVYEFLPWVRSRAAAALADPDLGGDLPARGAFDVGVHLNDEPSAAANARLEVAGPGDAVGIDPRHVVRRVPGDGTSDFEPNLFCAIEFDRPELPWLLTPAAAEPASQRLRPWIVLAVVEETAGVSLEPAQPLPVLRIEAPAAPDGELPDLDESWAWAHAQVLLEDGATQTAAEIARSSPALALSRLLCPRRLRPARPYIACVVPAFDLGARRGLGAGGSGAVARPAWRRGDASVRLPVYLHWRFATGAAGDFETLARRLAVRELPAELGRRTLFAGAGGPGLPEIAAAAGAVVDLGGALVPAGRALGGLDAAVARRLAEALDAATAPDGGDDEEEVRAPRYGSAALAGAAGDPPPWFGQLNRDPAARAAAGLGARAVREHQEELVFGAWSQAGQLGEANERLRGLDLAAAVGGSLRRRHLAPLAVGGAMQAGVRDAVQRRSRAARQPDPRRVRRRSLPQGGQHGGAPQRGARPPRARRRGAQRRHDPA